MITFTASVANQTFLVDRFAVTSGSYGSVGHATLCTDRTTLEAAGIDLFALSTSSAGSVEVDLDVTDDETGQTQRVFGGELVSSHWLYDQDDVEIHARDWAGQLVDQKRILTKLAQQIEGALGPVAPGENPNSSGIATQNQTVGNIVSAIANQFSLTPVLNLSGTVGNPTYGTLYGNTDTTFTSMPQSLWSVINQLARDCGYDVYVTPNRQLVFGEPGAGLSTIALSYNENPVFAPAIACRDLVVEHHPRRNATFRVIVLSYDPAKAQTAIGRADVVGTALAGTAGLRPGVTTGSGAAQVDQALLGIKGTASTRASPTAITTQIPLYTFHFDGLTAAQAQAKAEAIATDISKRELILSCEIDGYPLITPTQQVTIAGEVDYFVAGNTFYVNEYQHHFTMPRRGGMHTNQKAGFLTRIRALDIPTLGKDTASTL